MSSCVFPGSFDPFTCGHLDLVERASALFDTVRVTVMLNRSKIGSIPFADRLCLIRKACAALPNVVVDSWQGLLADYIRKYPGSIILRGVRNTAEFENEIRVADINRRLNPSAETLLMPASSQWADVSSSAVREIASFGGEIAGLVPDCIADDVIKWFCEPSKQIKGGFEDGE